MTNYMFAGPQNYFVEEPHCVAEAGAPGDSNGYMMLSTQPNSLTEQLLLLPFGFTLVLVATFGVLEKDILYKKASSAEELEGAAYAPLNVSVHIPKGNVALVQLESQERYGMATFKLIKV